MMRAWPHNPLNGHLLFAVNIVVVSRLVYRKGIDILAGVIPRLSEMKNVHFLIGGDGPKRSLLEEIREKANMQDRVTLLGPLEHSQVRTTAIYPITKQI